MGDDAGTSTEDDNSSPPTKDNINNPVIGSRRSPEQSAKINSREQGIGLLAGILEERRALTVAEDQPPAVTNVTTLLQNNVEDLIRVTLSVTGDQEKNRRSPTPQNLIGKETQFKYRMVSSLWEHN
ncbi:hypothetical protein R1sor_007275 [Riccia sorocarpa]|uniref:Uncharacterized protein n=1 Tax=Riccia sorocarpa TaxID=122646 RepID=A0ABD3HSN8_9MARC